VLSGVFMFFSPVTRDLCMEPSWLDVARWGKSPPSQVQNVMVRVVFVGRRGASSEIDWPGTPVHQRLSPFSVSPVIPQLPYSLTRP
jgi:hypothetical protein